MSKLFIFDLDGTLVQNRDFYEQVYSGSLDRVVYDHSGEEGLDILRKTRRVFDGKGELALFALGIPVGVWMSYLNQVSFDLVLPRPDLVCLLRNLEGVKVIYTGSPLLYTLRIIDRIGFSTEDFHEVIATEEMDCYPLKWSRSSHPFQSLMDKYDVDEYCTWSIGDVWETDLEPAARIGIQTILVGERGSDMATNYEDIIDFLKSSDWWNKEMIDCC